MHPNAWTRNKVMGIGNVWTTAIPIAGAVLIVPTHTIAGEGNTPRGGSRISGGARRV
jgi:hypothetical protein